MFTVQEGLEIEAVFTPGHIDDHMSFLLKDGKETILFSGDVILGVASTIVDDLPKYIETLRTLLKLNPNWICLPHSVHPTD